MSVGSTGRSGVSRRSTDDAYVQADNVTIAPKVSGYIETVSVDDNQPVKAGHVLAEIDERDYQAALDQAKADVAVAEASIASTRAQLGEQRALIDAGAARRSTPTRRAEVFAEQNDQRYGALAKSGYGTVQNAQQATSAGAARAKAIVGKDEAALEAANKAGRYAEGANSSQANATLDARPRGAGAGRTQSRLHDARRAGRRRGRRPHAARRPVRPAGHAVAWPWCRSRRPMSSPTTRRPSSPMCIPASRSSIEVDTFPGTSVRGTRRQPRAGERPGVRAAAARQRDRQLHQDRPAHPGEDHPRQRPIRWPGVCGRACRSTATIRIGADRRRQRRERQVAGRLRAMTAHGRHGRQPGHGTVATPRQWIAVFGCMLGAFMAVLNIQITNASLPDIEGGIGTGIDNGAWISTSYLIGEIIVIPLTDYLSRVFSFRRYLLGNASCFWFSRSPAPSPRTSTEMIVLRGLQGFTGGVLIPMAFTLVLTKLPKHQQPIGLAHVRAGGDLRARDRPDHRRLPDRELRLAVHLLRQPRSPAR